jgi:hypothetical protein
LSEQWKYQLRINLEDKLAEVARRNPDDPALAPLPDILAKHDARLKCQYDAFADYVAAAEKFGPDTYPLYAWTKATIENPEKEAKYKKSFTLYINEDEVYAQEEAEALEQDLKPLVGGEIVTRLAKHDTNPANNPQPPKRYRKG